jgi:hypothetical protein
MAFSWAVKQNGPAKNQIRLVSGIIDMPREIFRVPIFRNVTPPSVKVGQIKAALGRENIHMKRISAVALFVVTSLSAITSAAAQAPGIRANIPFAFTVADTWMPAGDYVITYPDSNVVEVRAVKGKAIAMVVSLPSSIESNSGSELEFNKYGNSYFLNRVLCPSNNGMNVDLAHGRAEKRARTLEAGLRNGEHVMIAAK